jgi:hypothetical protein
MFRFIIAPMGAGKSTFTAKCRDIRLPVFESDEARYISLERELKPLREARNWPAHNALWHAALKKWLRSLPPTALILVHSWADVQALGGGVWATIVVLPADDVHAVRRERRRMQGEELSLSLLNRSGVEWEAANHGLRVVSDFDQIPLDWLRPSPPYAYGPPVRLSKGKGVGR